jgi:hypothetical protein
MPSPRFVIHMFRFTSLRVIGLSALLAISSQAQTLNVPPRQTNAPTGSQLITILTPLAGPPAAARETEILSQILNGNVPNWLRTLKPITVSATISGTPHTATYYVTPDYMAIGSDADYFLIPMTPLLAQQIANRIGCTLPTRKMVNQIWTNAAVKMNPQPIPPSAAMTTVPVFADHNTMVRTQRNTFTNSQPLGALVGGDKKDVIISNLIRSNLMTPSKPVVIYGWHYTSGSPIQNAYNGHEETYADYSHGIRMVQMAMTVDGNANTVTNVLTNPTLAALLSDETIAPNNTITLPYYNPANYALISITTHPYSQTVSVGANPMLRVVASGDAPLRYQWNFNGSALSAATNSILTITNAQTTNAGTYSVTVTNNAGSATSRPAVLKVSSISYPQLFSDDFNSANSATNWSFFFDSPNGVSDYTTNWGFDYSATVYTFNGGPNYIPPAPNSTDGTTRGLKISVNSNDGIGTNAAVNLYAKNKNFGSNFVFKCDLWLNYPGNAAGTGTGVSGSTQFGLFGINHAGVRPNWAATTASATDGIWFAADGEGGISTDYRAYVGNSSGVQTDLTSSSGGLSASNSAATLYQNLFPASRFESAGAPGKNWVTVEISQIDGVITWKLDDVTVAQRANTSAFTNGTTMIGLMDVFPSIATPTADSFVIFDNVRVENLSGAASLAPTITLHPQSQTSSAGGDATFVVSASGTAPLSYQWRFNGTNVLNATGTSYTRTNIQPADAGSYFVVVTNIAGSVTSAVATLSIASDPITLFEDDFDDHESPEIVTSATTTNGYKILFGASNNITDFKAIFGFDYSTVTHPTTIPSAPNTVSGTRKGLLLTVNKADAVQSQAAVNLYPLGLFASGDYSFKFDLWINWTNVATSTEHALFGINHSANITNRIQQTMSDGLFFAVNGDGGSSATSTTARDFSCFRGSNGIPFLMLTNTATFGPAPLLGNRFCHLDPGFAALFPSKPINTNTLAGSPGLGWVTVEVRQINNLITFLLNDTLVAQYTNAFAYTNGTVMVGYNDAFASIGDTNNFAIFDNLRVESLAPVAAARIESLIAQEDLTVRLEILAPVGFSYALEACSNLTSLTWTEITLFQGSNAPVTITDMNAIGQATRYYRTRRL